MTQSDWWKALQPLRIPSGWKIEWNKLRTIEPDSLSFSDQAWWDFTEDILYLYITYKRRVNHISEEQRLSFDLGWYPDCDPKGQFHLLAILGEDWEHPLKKFASRSLQRTVAIIEQWLFQDFYALHWINPQ